MKLFKNLKKVWKYIGFLSDHFSSENLEWASAVMASWNAYPNDVNIKGFCRFVKNDNGYFLVYLDFLKKQQIHIPVTKLSFESLVHQSKSSVKIPGTPLMELVEKYHAGEDWNSLVINQYKEIFVSSEEEIHSATH